MKEPVIFLDIDGVLVTWGSLERTAFKSPPSGIHAEPHKPCVEELNRIIRETGAKIVLSSTWRFTFDCALAVNKFLFPRMGVIGECIGVTPRGAVNPGGVIELSTPRGREIAAWLKENPTDKFVILDDDSDMEHLMAHLVFTSMREGLTREHADEAIKRLTLPQGRLQGMS